MTIAQLLTSTASWLHTSPSPHLDAEILLSYVLNTTRSSLLAHPEKKLTPLQSIKFWWLIFKRQRGIPIAYLTHHKEFYGREFYVNKHTLIPRPATETLIDCTLNFIKNNPRLINTIADIGTGSGCVAITLAQELPNIKIIATDISRRALRVTKINSTNHNVPNQVQLLYGNLLTPLIKHNLITPQTLLVSNLPYLDANEIIGEIQYEPLQALVAMNEV